MHSAWNFGANNFVMSTLFWIGVTFWIFPEKGNRYLCFNRYLIFPRVSTGTKGYQIYLISFKPVRDMEMHGYQRDRGWKEEIYYNVKVKSVPNFNKLKPAITRTASQVRYSNTGLGGI